MTEVVFIDRESVTPALTHQTENERLFCELLQELAAGRQALGMSIAALKAVEASLSGARVKEQND